MSENVMLIGFGSGAGVKIRIKTYATEELRSADKPGNGTIGILTSNPLSGYFFGPEAPSYLKEGLLWIQTGTTSPAAFDALPGSNVLMIYPGQAKQYTSEAWAAVSAKTYRDGTWMAWDQWIVTDGKADREIITLGLLPEEVGGYAGSLTVAEENTTISFTPGEGGSGAVAHFGEYDLTAFSTLTFEGGWESSDAYATVSVAVWSSIDAAVTHIRKNLVKEAQTAAENGTVTLDVAELTGKLVVGFLYSGAFAIAHVVKNLRLKPAA